MKLRHAMIITFVLGLFAFNVHSEEYKAPKLQFKAKHKSKSYSVTQEKDFREFGENTYRVQENDYSDRNLASEVEPEPAQPEDGRNPSSHDRDRGPVPEQSPEPQAKSWKYNK